MSAKRQRYHHPHLHHLKLKWQYWHLIENKTQKTEGEEENWSFESYISFLQWLSINKNKRITPPKKNLNPELSPIIILCQLNRDNFFLRSYTTFRSLKKIKRKKKNTSCSNLSAIKETVSICFPPQFSEFPFSSRNSTQTTNRKSKLEHLRPTKSIPEPTQTTKYFIWLSEKRSKEMKETKSLK